MADLDEGELAMTEREYVLLEAMTADDVKYNVDRMRGAARKASSPASAKALIDHANALQNWHEKRRVVPIR